MKHRFLLDENILYFAINGTDEHDDPDLTCATLVRQIGANCHKIVLNTFLLNRYHSHLRRMIGEQRRARALQPVSFIRELLNNSDKRGWEHEDCPELPEGVEVPRKDIEIVRLALLARSHIVTCDGPLRTAVNASPVLNLRALTPAEALIPAADS